MSKERFDILKKQAERERDALEETAYYICINALKDSGFIVGEESRKFSNDLADALRGIAG